MTVTLADIKRKQDEYREVLKAYKTKRAEVAKLKAQFHQAEMELEAILIAARPATHELRQLGAEFALQVEDDFTPKIPGTEQPGELLWSPEDSHHPQAFDDPDWGYIAYNNPGEMPIKHNGQPLYSGGTVPYDPQTGVDPII